MEDNSQKGEKISLWREIPSKQRNYKMLIGSMITLEGLIGVGKTTLGYSLEHYLKSLGLKVKFYPEFKDLNFLKLYINNMEKYAFPFQVIMLKARLEVYREAHYFSKRGGISIIDRSLIGDYTFALMQKNKKYFSDEEWGVYLSMMSYSPDNEPDYTLFLDCSPEEAFERMLKRSINSEVEGYTLSYFKDLNETYRKTIKSVIHPVIFVPWEDQPGDLMDGKLTEKKCDEVLEHIRGKIIK